jgi:hypothetical protein
VASVVVVDRGPRIFIVRPSASVPSGYPLPPDPDPAQDPRGGWIPAPLVDLLRSLPTDVGVRASSDALRDALAARLGRDVPLATTVELRSARATLPPWDPVEERAFLLAAARAGLERALRSPEEILITLTREEERLERAVGREARASESFLVVTGSSLAEYARKWTGVRETLERHLATLVDLVATEARTVVPNLSRVVGERAAARLVSAAGSVAALARMRAGRIQLLGTRRRPSPERGPRYGILYRADGMADVPAGRRGAYARSLAAIAAIAVRADATTRTPIAKGLVARRDRRIAQLRARR